MSYRGTFTTEYIYCDKCVQAIIEALDGYSPTSCWKTLGGPYGYAQGFFKDTSATEGFWSFMSALSEARICEDHHPKIAVFWEGRPPVILTLPVEQI